MAAFVDPVDHDGVLYLMATPPHSIFDPHQMGSCGTALIAVTAVFLPLATLAVGIRFYTRTIIEKRFTLDDGFMYAAWIFNILHVGWTLSMLKNGLAKHMWNVPLTDFSPNFLLEDVIGQLFFWLSTGMAKCSILLFYLHLFPVRALYIAVWLAFAFVFLYSVAGSLVDLFACRPVAATWDLELALRVHPTCINQAAFYISQAALFIAADVLTFIIPLPLLWTLRLQLKQKLVIAFLLTVGASVSILSSYRLKLLVDLGHTIDFTYKLCDILLLCIIESQFSIIGGCVPTFKPFAQRLFPSLFKPSNSSAEEIYLSSTLSSHRYKSRVEATPGVTSNHKVTVTSKPRTYTGESDENRMIVPDESGRSGNAQIAKTVDFGYESEGGTVITDDGRSVANEPERRPS